MQIRDEKLGNVQRHVFVIENKVFADFCRDINVPDINYYEKNHLWYKLSINFIKLILLLKFINFIRI